MDDSLKGLTIGFLALLVLHGSLQRRVRRDAEHQVRTAFDNSGSIHASVAPRGMFGLFANDIWSVDVYGQGIVCDHIPFYRYPREGWKGSIRHLRLHLSDFTLVNFPIDRMDADIPFVTYDLGESLYRDRLVVRGSGTGTIEVRVGEVGLQKFISNKYKHTLSDVSVSIHNNELQLSANLALFGSGTRIVATGTVAPREGHYLDLVQPVLLINGKVAQPALLQGILSRINPVLDVDTDLHMGGFFSMNRVWYQGHQLIVTGQITLPLDPAQQTDLLRNPSNQIVPSKQP